MGDWARELWEDGRLAVFLQPTCFRLDDHDSVGDAMADIAQQMPGGSPAAAIDEAKRQKLLELVRGRALARPTDLAEDEVMVWPSLVVVEAVCATVFLLILIAVSVLFNAPLDGAGQSKPDAEPLKGAVVLPEPAGAAAAHGCRTRRRHRPHSHWGRSRPSPI